jgi:hypothetical protein
LSARIFGDLSISYLVVAKEVETCRLLVKVTVRYPGGPVGWLMRCVLPWDDLVMMRRQLLNFKELAEQTHARG